MGAPGSLIFNDDDVYVDIFYKQNHVLFRRAPMTFKFWKDDTEIDGILLQLARVLL